MKQISKIIAIASLSALSISCTSEKEKTATLTFEGGYWTEAVDSPQYGGKLLYGEPLEGGMYGGTDYGWHDFDGTGLASEICESNGSRIYWNGGHAISNYIDADVKNCTFERQLSIPIKPFSGKNFCVHNGYLSDFSSVTGYFYFKDKIARTIDNIHVTNTSYYLSEANAKAKGDDWTKIIATGYDLNGNEIGKSEFYLTENGKSITGWRKWSLRSMGPVYKVTFNIQSSITGDYGMNVPGYFAYDDVTVILPE